MSFQQAVRSGFANDANFHGRASRPVFGWWSVVVVPLLVFAPGLDTAPGHGGTATPGGTLGLIFVLTGLAFRLLWGPIIRFVARRTGLSVNDATVMAILGMLGVLFLAAFVMGVASGDWHTVLSAAGLLGAVALLGAGVLAASRAVDRWVARRNAVTAARQAIAWSTMPPSSPRRPDADGPGGPASVNAFPS
jgi:hypothetical protein